MNRLFSRVAAGWDRFWFETQMVSTLAVFRIAFGLLTTVWLASFIPNLFEFFGPHSIMSNSDAGASGTLHSIVHSLHAEKHYHWID